MEEKEITDHREMVIKATRQVLLEVFKLLENFHESLILVGGWVPIMIIPEAAEKLKRDLLIYLLGRCAVKPTGRLAKDSV